MPSNPAATFAARNVAYSTDERIVERSFTLNGIPIRLSRTVYVQHDVILPETTGVRFQAVRRRWYHLLLGIFAVGRPIGHPALDAAAAVSTSTAQATRAFFEHPARGSLAAQIIERGGQIRWHDDHVIVDIPTDAFPDDGLAQVTLLLDTVLSPAPLLATPDEPTD